MMRRAPWTVRRYLLKPKSQLFTIVPQIGLRHLVPSKILLILLILSNSHFSLNRVP
jgi:hypothetical protein